MLTRDSLDNLVRQTFGTDLISSQRLRWYIGADGWVEDLVLKTKFTGMAGVDPLDDSQLKDKIALLHEALFATAYGGDLVPIDSNRSGMVRGLAPNLHASAAEVIGWIEDPQLVWHQIGASDDESVIGWPSILANASIGAYESQDGTLAMLTFPKELLNGAYHDVASLSRLRIPFREFAVASDSVFGCIWTSSQVAILARARNAPLSAVPPLRFETFALLASQSTDELDQSYERNTVFAGKLRSGPYADKDWAPVYLSPALIDTEFGTLLNVDDQMLKSWSEAGYVEYLYFDYPKPDHFPFDKELSTILEAKFRSESTLFNWNTSGSSVVVRHSPYSVLVAKQTGALPVTYGANGKPKSEGGEDLYDYEEKAYGYFADLRDPNLARAAQYTLLYQSFRAIARESSSSSERVSAPHRITSRTTAVAVLATAIMRLLDAVDSHRVSEPTKLISDSLVPKLTAFRQQHPEMSNDRLGEILADRSSAEGTKYRQQQQQKLIGLAESLAKERTKLKQDIDDYNTSVNAQSSFNSASLLIEKEDLERRRNELEAKEGELETLARAPDPLDEISQDLWLVASEKADLEEVRKAYVDAASGDKDVPIRTASIVMSWDRKEGLWGAVGGHNVKAKALHLEPSPDVKDLDISVGPDGTRTLRYNPGQRDSVEAHATDLARLIEHRDIDDTAALKELISKPAALRSRTEALELNPMPSEAKAKAVFGRLGDRFYTDKKPFVDDLRGIAEQNDCCIFVARDENQTAYIAEKNPKTPPPPSLAYEVRDTPSLQERLLSLTNERGGRSGRAIIFLDEPEDHVQALALSLSSGGGGRRGGWTELAQALGEEGAQPRRRVSAVIQDDLEGEPSFLKTIASSVEASGNKLLERLGISVQKESWRSAEVSVVDREGIVQMLKLGGWDEGRDGIPTAIMVSFQPSPQSPPDLAVIAGFREQDLPQGRVQLRTAHELAVAKASNTAATPAQYLMSVRNRLRALPQAQIKRLMLVVKDGETETLLTKSEFQDKIHGGS